MSRRGITDSAMTRCSCLRCLISSVRSVKRFLKRRTRFPTAATPFVNFARNCPKTLRKSDILARLFGCRDVAQPGSAPALGAGCRRFESCRPDQSRVWFNGRTEAFQASNAGSIPVTRSTKTPGQSLNGSGLFVCGDNSGDKLVLNFAQRPSIRCLLCIMCSLLGHFLIALSLACKRNEE